MDVVIRGDVNSIHVGSRSNIQEGVVVHAMTVKRLLTHAEVAEIQLYTDRYVQYRLDYM